MIRIHVATEADADDVLRLAVALVAEDAGRHDADATDVTWAERSGQSYVSGALTGDNVVLLARDGGEAVGHLVGRLGGPGSVHPIRSAELESLYVVPGHRGGGTGSLLVERFLAWAAEHGAVRASVTAYAANEGARRFYERHGFAPRSVVLDRPLQR